jgi:ureidoglycolate hydrolase
MRVIRISVETLTSESFSPYGILIDRRGSVEIELSSGMVSLTGATTERRPFRFEFMARHRRTVQVFSPLVASQSIIAVARPNERDAPDIETVKAFFIDGRWPYALHRGTWHAPPFPLGEWASYLVIDRAGTLEEDYELADLRATANVMFEIAL